MHRAVFLKSSERVIFITQAGQHRRQRVRFGVLRLGAELALCASTQTLWVLRPTLRSEHAETNELPANTMLCWQDECCWSHGVGVMKSVAGVLAVVLLAYIPFFGQNPKPGLFRHWGRSRHRFCAHERCSARLHQVPGAA